MTRTVNAVYENGVLRPLDPLDGIEENTRVRVTIDTNANGIASLTECIGSLPDDDAEDMRNIVEREFERIDADQW